MPGINDNLRDILAGQTAITTAQAAMVTTLAVHNEHHQALEQMVEVHDQKLFGIGGKPGLIEEHTRVMARGGHNCSKPSRPGWQKALLYGLFSTAGGGLAYVIWQGIRHYILKGG